MTRGRRTALAALALIALGVAFALARPGGNGEDEEAAPAATTTATESPAPAPPAETAAPAPETAPAETAAPEPAPAETTPISAAPKPLRIETKGGTPVGGVRELVVHAGDVVRFAVTSDVAEEVHVHGYDILKEVGPAAPARFRFEATLEGIYEVELEGSGEPILELRVEP